MFLIFNFYRKGSAKDSKGQAVFFKVNSGTNDREKTRNYFSIKRKVVVCYDTLGSIIDLWSNERSFVSVFPIEIF